MKTTAVTNALKEEDTINWGIRQGHVTCHRCRAGKFPTEICEGVKEKEWRI